MKLIKIYITFLFISLISWTFAQEKFYYKDTLFEYAGLKIQLKKSVSTDQYFKTSMIITNTTENFIILKPEQLFGYVSGSTSKVTMASKKSVVIPPKYSKGFTAKFIGTEFRQPSLEIDISRFQLTDKIEAIYEINDFNFFTENKRKVGPVTWNILKVVQGTDKDELTKNLRIDGTIEYSGDKFLSIFYNNISLRTNENKTYINEGKFAGVFSKNKFHYDKSKQSEKLILIFPIENQKVSRDIEPRIYFNEAFKEYSLIEMEGCKIILQQGTISDFNRSGKDNDIEEME